MQSNHMDTGLEGKKILVTGSSGGIGKAIIEILIQEKAVPIIHYNSRKESVEELEKLAKSEGLEYLICQADVSKETDVRVMFNHIDKKFGGLDGLVNNAGIWPEKNTPIHEMSLNQWENTLNVNLKSIFLCSKEFMKNREKHSGEFGSIVLIGSTAGVFGEEGHIDYSSSKAALHGFMLSLKNEIVRVIRYGRVNIVSPGWTLTRMAENELKNHSGVTKALQTIPLRKIANARDIAKSVVHLLSDELSSHVSGQNIVIAGGMEGRLQHEKHEIDINRVLI
ncbi:MAG: SDR family NAD(P)-dependent oxidoreductase [Candidatus Kariarchaeaceae archaeon]